MRHADFLNLKVIPSSAIKKAVFWKDQHGCNAIQADVGSNTTGASVPFSIAN